MSGTGAPKGNRYRKGKKAAETGFTIGLYVSAHEASVIRDILRHAHGVEPSQSDINAYARQCYKSGVQIAELNFSQSQKLVQNSSEKS